jgi:hypothetical protein
MASALAALLAASYLGTAEVANAAGYNETNLVVGGPDAKLVAGVPTLSYGTTTYTAQLLDPNLVNAWGLASTPTSQIWVSDNGSNLSTTYNVSSATPLVVHLGTRVVSIPSPGDPLGASGTPTGIAWNPATAAGEFKIPGYLFPSCKFTPTAAAFLWATEDGTIVGFSGNLYPTLELCKAAPNPPKNMNGDNVNGIIAVDNSARGQGGGGGVGTGKGKGFGVGAVYKGIAISPDGKSLYVTNFKRGQVEIYNGTFGLVHSFTDPNVPNGYAPFNVSVITGKLFVTFAVQNQERHDDVAGPGNGIVDTFDLSGDNLKRFATGGALNSPWGLALAPSGTPAPFGELSGKLLIGNFGDGKINAFDPVTGGTSVALNKPCVAPCTPQPVVIAGLWALKFGNGAPGLMTPTMGGSTWNSPA